MGPIRKVWMLTPLFFPVKAGTEVHVYNLSKELLRLSVPVEIHTTRDTYDAKRVLSEEENVDGLKVVRHDRTWRYGDSPSILHIHNLGRKYSLWNLYTFYYLLVESRFRDTPVVMTPHDILIVHKGKVISFIEKLAGRRLNGIIAVSEWEREKMIELGYEPSKIEVIPNGVEDRAYEQPKEEKNGEYILYLARFSKEKGQLFAVECLKRIPVRMIMAGQIRDQEYFRLVMNRVKELGLEDRVRYLGVVSDEEKYKLMDGALALVLTSEVEAEGIVVKEAMARGTPVIVGRKAEVLPTIVKDGENGFVISDCEDLREAVEKLKNGRVREEISRRNLELSKQWRWSAIAKKTLEYYSTLLSGMEQKVSGSAGTGI